MVGLTAIGLVVGLLLGAGGAALVLRRPATPVSTQAAGDQPTAATSTSAAVTPTPTHYSGDLRDLLLPAPTTSHPFAKPISKDGTITADQIASAFEDPARAMQALQQNEFVAGAVEQWHDADDTEVLIKLYQFGSADEAKSWQYFNQAGYASDSTTTDQSPIDGIDDSGCWVTKKVDSLGLVDTLGIATQHDIYMLVRVYQPHEQIRSRAIAIMKQQFARLP
jgi:hypothetical protein